MPDADYQRELDAVWSLYLGKSVSTVTDFRERPSDWNSPSPLRERLVAEIAELGLVCADFLCFCEHCERTACIFCYMDFTDPRDGPVVFGPDCSLVYMPPEALESVAACLAFGKALVR